MRRPLLVPRGTIWALFFLVSQAAHGSTWNVDPSGLGDGVYIGDVIALAASGDTIEVAAGTYREPVDFGGKDLTIVSIDGADSTVISAPVGAAVIVENGESVAATLDGFTILNSEIGLSVHESSISVSNCVFRGGGQTEAQGAGVRAYAATVLLENVLFEDNISAYGAIFADSETHLFGTNVSFSANEGEFGADVYANNAVLDFETFESAGSFASYGGSLVVIDSSLKVNNLTITGAYAIYSGGALYAEESTIEITNSIWDGARNDSGTGSTASLQGGSATFATCSVSESMSTGTSSGAVHVSDGELHMSECTFEANQNNEGGHLSASNSTLSFTNGELKSGQAEAGGAIAATSSDVSISGVLLTENTADSVGGAIYSADSALTLEACELEANTASQGGAIALEASEAWLTDSQFIKNRASDDGGAIAAIAADTLSFDGVHFENNEAADKGGAVHATDAHGITIQDTRFTGNIAGDLGGAIWSYGTNAIIALRTLFWSNSAADGAGAVYQNKGASDWTNTLFQDNETSAGGGGALMLNAVEFTMTNSDVLANESFCCGAIYAYDSSVELVNNIVAWNSVGGVYTADDDTAEQQAHRYNTWFQNSLYHWGGTFEDRSGEEGNALQDPSVRNFSDDGDATNDQLSLQDGSPCIDAGLPGHTDWDGSSIDIGLYGGPDAGSFDIDQDGATVESGDCEDQDDTILPGAEELCDGLDNDCDGGIDEGCSGDTSDTGESAPQGHDDTGSDPGGNGGGAPGKVVLHGECGCRSTGNATGPAICSVLFAVLLSIRRRSFTAVRGHA